MQYTPGDVSKLMSFSPILNGVELQPPVSNVFPSHLPRKNNVAATVCIFAFLLIAVTVLGIDLFSIE